MAFLRIGAGSVYYRLAGSGPTVVFVNSLGSSLAIWDEVIEALPGVRTLRYDLRGHGLSDAPAGPYTLQQLAGDTLELMDALQIESAVICGISIGGMIALQAALQAPERVSGLVLCNTGLKLGSATTWHERAAQVRSQGLEALADAALSRWFTPAFQNRPAAAGARNMLTRTSREGYAGCCEALASADLHAHARSIAVPARVLVGEHDPATPPALAQELTGALPTAELHVIPQAAHLSCVEQPQAIAVQIRASLQQS